MESAVLSAVRVTPILESFAAHILPRSPESAQTMIATLEVSALSLNRAGRACQYRI